MSGAARCPRGHARTRATAYVTDGYLACRACRAEDSARFRARRAARLCAERGHARVEVETPSGRRVCVVCLPHLSGSTPTVCPRGHDRASSSKRYGASRHCFECIRVRGRARAARLAEARCGAKGHVRQVMMLPSGRRVCAVCRSQRSARNPREVQQ